MRSLSAKNTTSFKSLSKNSSRPISAKKLKPYLLRGLASINSDESLLIRLRPVNVRIDKERLFEENMSLKIELNKTKEELTKSNTKVYQLERDIYKTNEAKLNGKRKNETNVSLSDQKTHLINSLKQKIKELRQESNEKTEEISKLKKTLKHTTVLELKTELKTYQNECTRIRNSLSELMKQSESRQDEKNQA